MIDNDFYRNLIKDILIDNRKVRINIDEIVNKLMEY